MMSLEAKTDISRKYKAKVRKLHLQYHVASKLFINHIHFFQLLIHCILVSMANVLSKDSPLKTTLLLTGFWPEWVLLVLRHIGEQL